MNVLVLIVVLVFGIALIIGFQRGLFKSIVGVAAVVLSLILSYILAPAAFQYVTENTQVDEYVEEQIYAKIKASVEEEIRQKLQESGVFASTDDLNAATEQETEDVMQENPDRNEQTELISLQSIPGFLKTKLLENNNKEMYEKLGVDNVYRYIARSTALSIVNIAVTIACFLVMRLILFFVSLAMTAAIENIKVVDVVNRIGGMAAAALVALVIVWIIMVIYSLIDGEAYEIMLNQNQMLTKLDEINLISKMLYSMGA